MEMFTEIKLYRSGFHTLVIRNTPGGWEYLMNTDWYGTKRWQSIPIPKQAILEQIEQYKWPKDMIENPYDNLTLSNCQLRLL